MSYAYTTSFFFFFLLYNILSLLLLFFLTSMFFGSKLFIFSYLQRRPTTDCFLNVKFPFNSMISYRYHDSKVPVWIPKMFKTGWRVKNGFVIELVQHLEQLKFYLAGEGQKSCVEFPLEFSFSETEEGTI